MIWQCLEERCPFYCEDNDFASPLGPGELPFSSPLYVFFFVALPSIAVLGRPRENSKHPLMDEHTHTHPQVHDLLGCEVYLNSLELWSRQAL